MSMFEATALAREVESISRLIVGQAPHPLQVGRMLYYAQGLWLTYHRVPLFREEFRAATHGPLLVGLVPSHEDDRHGRHVHDGHNLDLPAPLREMLKEVVEAFGIHTMGQLSRATRCERPWQRAREGLRWSDRALPSMDTTHIHDFFADMIETGEDVMESLGMRREADQPAWLGPYRTACNVKYMAEHPLFEGHHARRLRVDLGFDPVPEDWSSLEPSPPGGDHLEEPIRKHA